jgi:hypothetical protein
MLKSFHPFVSDPTQKHNPEDHSKDEIVRYSLPVIMPGSCFCTVSRKAADKQDNCQKKPKRLDNIVWTARSNDKEPRRQERQEERSVRNDE